MCHSKALSQAHKSAIYSAIELSDLIPIAMVCFCPGEFWENRYQHSQPLLEAEHYILQIYDGQGTHNSLCYLHVTCMNMCMSHAW